ncbi:hypothetical protein RRG08_002856 [Elysia crispata]|uniref:Uncharacterized protein n=1 Tax=Elysia crispata TaxID=231223 RepID=A0AAE1CM55_9GAST|nr:hypothetical protein RRG08_002856 [Elysia crispata]
MGRVKAQLFSKFDFYCLSLVSEDNLALYLFVLDLCGTRLYRYSLILHNFLPFCVVNVGRGCANSLFLLPDNILVLHITHFPYRAKTERPQADQFTTGFTQRNHEIDQIVPLGHFPIIMSNKQNKPRLSGRYSLGLYKHSAERRDAKGPLLLPSANGPF